MIKKIVRWFFILTSLTGLTLAGMCADVQLRYIKRLRLASDQDARASTAIILGASVKASGQPSDALRDRLLVGSTLYKEGHVRQILITGDDGAYHAKEIESMHNFLLKQGIPKEAILADPHGYRTYESCKRAANVYQIKDAIIITQRFHIARALYLCESFGIQSIGVTSDLTNYQRIVYFWARDLAASIKAWSDVHIIPPQSPIKTLLMQK
ncbi:YdcF family protein [Candidatus Uhrbacteria bacterium]|nr:YdcF family protein [Candidatus Uhrbacteria bacterium]